MRVAMIEDARQSVLAAAASIAQQESARSAYLRTQLQRRHDKAMQEANARAQSAESEMKAAKARAEDALAALFKAEHTSKDWEAKAMMATSELESVRKQMSAAQSDHGQAMADLEDKLRGLEE